MLRALFGWLLGFNKEIEKLKKELTQLGWDSAWGIHTKSVLPVVNGSNGDGYKTVALLSFNSLDERKRELGNVEIDNRIKAIFRQPLRASDIVAKWSDNEVVIVLASSNGGAEIPLKRLAADAENKGLTFAYVMKECQCGRGSLPETVRELSKILNKKGE